MKSIDPSGQPTIELKMLLDNLKSLVPRPLRRLPRTIREMGRQQLRKISIPDGPFFDQEGTEYFVHRILNCSNYLEYGSGGSTILVATRDIPFTTIDSD